ncbi:unnamed protein product [Sphenostylis stenocarpa]|uniref:Uncharacterized protein n=1 Tax=Sphenostylis stenocarpa TaxID=92480 RepID=A0AA87B8D5_9FABA|nr:unnamed protein product [Sphenostylis stenocarpa]
MNLQWSSDACPLHGELNFFQMLLTDPDSCARIEVFILSIVTWNFFEGFRWWEDMEHGLDPHPNLEFEAWNCSDFFSELTLVRSASTHKGPHSSTQTLTCGDLMSFRENAIELLQRYRRDRRVLLDFILSGSLIKKVVMPPGAVTLDDVDLDQVSVDYVLNCAKKSTMLELSEAIRDYHDHTGLPQMSDTGSVGEFYLVTDPGSSGSPPRRPPPTVPISAVLPVAVSAPSVFPPSPIVSSVSRSESFNTTQEKELTVDDIEDFEDDDDASVVEGFRAKRTLNDASDLAVKLPSFSTGISDDDLRETAYEVLLACAGATGGLIVPSKEKKKEKKSSLIRKLGRSKSGSVVSQSQSAPGLVGLLETMRVQMEMVYVLVDKVEFNMLLDAV